MENDPKMNNLMARLRAKRQQEKDQLERQFEYFETHAFSTNQLGWLEDYPDYWVEVLALSKGIDFIPNQPRDIIQIRDLTGFVLDHPTHNIWRSWNIKKRADKFEDVGLVPFWLDIDDETGDLSNARIVTLACIDSLLSKDFSGGNPENFRIGFSGKKGFHIYMKPILPIEGRSVRKELVISVHGKLSPETLDSQCSNYIYKNTIIDVFHEDIRVMGSLHSWTDNNGEIKAFRTFEMAADEFQRLNIDELIQRSKTQ